MNTPWYYRKKMWVGIITAVSMITADLLKNPELATKILAIGMTLIGGFSLEDMGKAKQQIIEEAKVPPVAEVDTGKLNELIQKAVTENPELLVKKS